MPPLPPEVSDFAQGPEAELHAPFGIVLPLSHAELGDAILEADYLVPPEVQALGGLLFEMSDLDSAEDCGEANAETPKGLLSQTFSGERLRKTRSRLQRLSPIPQVLDPDPRLHALIGRPELGKTSFALWVAQRWGERLPAWDGCAELPGSRVLVISREQSVEQIDALLQRFAESEENQ